MILPKYKIVTGSPRSGTSINCRMHIRVFGEDKMTGRPQPRVVAEQAGDTELEKYRKRQIKLRVEEGIADETNINPLGFYEDGRFCMGGVSNVLRCGDLPESGNIIKIISRGLIDTDPRMVESLMATVRHPFSNASAQQMIKNAPKEPSPRMWTRDLNALCAFMLAFPDVPTLIVHHEDLIKRPKTELKRYTKFYKQDFSQCYDLIGKYKARALPEYEGPQWDQALAVYALFRAGNYQEVLDYRTSLERKKQDLHTFFCPRVGQQTTRPQCKLCLDPERTGAHRMLQVAARRNKVEWQKEPCLYLCGEGGEELTTLQETIDSNHWVQRPAYVEHLEDQAILKKERELQGVERAARVAARTAKKSK